jgi:hypothetical protein
MSVSFFQRRLSKAITCSLIPWWLLLTTLTVISLPSHADNTQDKVNHGETAQVNHKDTTKDRKREEAK